MNLPVLVQDYHAGRVAFARDLERHLGSDGLEDRGWVKPDDITLLVPMFAAADLYLLRLVFDYYPKCPPSAQFVNPLTCQYAVGVDRKWVPHSEQAPNIHFHPNYSGRQLICSSSTLEFYQVSHSVETCNVWTPETMTFATTIAAIRAALVHPYYQGRHE